MKNSKKISQNFEYNPTKKYRFSIFCLSIFEKIIRRGGGVPPTGTPANSNEPNWEKSLDFFSFLGFSITKLVQLKISSKFT